jgi:hypothetical protein
MMSKKIYWLVAKEKVDNANLKAMQKYIQNHKKTFLDKKYSCQKRKPTRLNTC